MAPRQREPSIDRSNEYEQFIKDLELYHEKRGTHFEAEPKVGPRHLDLLRLYQRVTEEGGYDKASDTKGNKLAWRRIAQEFLPGSANVVQLAFLVKTAYYKNLAAYEISTFHKREPPPKEILEDVSAKGGDLLNRTLENYLPRASREADNLANGDRSDASDDEHNTPKDGDKMDLDEPGSTGARLTRALRHAPPQRVLFGAQPDGSTGRQTRGSAGQNSPTPGSTAVNGTYTSNGAAFTIANYEPRAILPSTVKQVTTPAQNPDHFRNEAKRLLQARKFAKGYLPPRGPMMLPGTGFTGPNIYIRALLALKSGQPSEIRYALHHLVKISHERGDKYMFEQFPSLAEELLEQVLQISSMFYNVKWRISYADELSHESDVLNGVVGTPDLLKKVRSHALVPVTDGLQTEEFSTMMSNTNEAALVLRNMAMLEANALHLARIPLTRDFVAIALTLPPRAPIIELQHYALEIAEQITKYFVLGVHDPLYVTLLAQLDRDDRGAIVTCLRALSRISMNLEAKNRLPDVPVHSLLRICDWLLVEDEELRNACLDFLYQFTAVTENVEVILQNINAEVLVGQLVRILMYGATLEEKRERSKSTMKPSATATAPPKLSASIVEQLCQITDEREQSAAWLRTCFEEDPTGEITQLALWSAYNEAFSSSKRGPLMQAKDFITNVSATFSTAQAQVVPSEDPQRPKYTIRGVRPRAVPVDQRGRPYMRCLWQTPASRSNGIQQDGPPLSTVKPAECDMCVAKPEEMWEHIMSTHLGLTKEAESGKFKVEEETKDLNKTYSCHWGGCQSLLAQKQTDVRVVAQHVQTHLPDSSSLGSLHRSHNITAEALSSRSHPNASTSGKGFLNTAMDEKGEGAGLPLASVLVLRNLARQMGKIDAANAAAGRQTKGEVTWVEKCFAPVKERLFYVMAWNFSLRDYLPTLEALIHLGVPAPV